MHVIALLLLLITGMVNSGLGEMGVNSLLSALNIPGIHHRSLKKREQEVGEQINNLARESCAEALQEEHDL